MSLEEIKKVEGLVSDLQTGLGKLEEAQKAAAKNSDEKFEKRLNDAVEDILKKQEAITAKQSQIEAALNRPGFATDDGAKQSPEQKAQDAAFRKYLAHGFDSLSADERKAMSTDSNPNGGYLVPVQNLGIIDGRIFESSPVRSIANVVKTNAKSVEVLMDDDEAGSGWVGEGDSISETNTPQIGRLEIAAHKLYSYPKITEEMAADSAFDVNAWLMRKVGDKFGRDEATAFVGGNGVKQPRGFLTYAAWASPGVYERGKIEQISSGSTSVPTEAGLIDLQASLKEGYQQRATWAMARATFGQIMKLAGSNTYRFINWQPNTGPQGTGIGGSLTLMDKPVRLMSDMPVISSNSLSIAYGDFSSAYTIVDRVGVSVKVDPLTSPGLIKYYANKRVGGAVTNFDALKLQKSA